MTAERAVAVALAVALLGAAAPPARAGDAKHTVRRSTYRALEAIHEAIADARWDDALEKIDALAPRVRGVPYERAVLDRTKAYALLEQERYADAIPVIEAALAADVLPPEAAADLHYDLAQLHLLAGRAEDAVRTLEASFASGRVEPSPRGRALAAHAYHLLGRHARAREEIERAIAATETPPTRWLELLLATCYEQKAFARARDVLRELVARVPDERRYFVELSAVSLYLDDGPTALASLELAEDAGVLEPRDLLQLARLSLHLDAPARAGRLLDDAIRSGRLAPDADHLELLADAWVMAREYERAVDALARAAEAAPERRAALALRRGELLVHLERWDDALDALAGPTASADADVAAQANLLTGVASYYRGDYAKSLVAFDRAGTHERTRRRAREWSAQTRRRIE